MDRGVVVQGKSANGLKTLSNSLVSNGRRVTESIFRDTGLTDDICNPKSGGNRDELDVTQGEG
jgi:hypothetical protein